jgi:hypothetical protein
LLPSGTISAQENHPFENSLCLRGSIRSEKRITRIIAQEFRIVCSFSGNKITCFKKSAVSKKPVSLKRKQISDKPGSSS